MNSKLIEFGIFPTSESLSYCRKQKRVFLWKGYPFPMLATELLTTEWKGHSKRVAFLFEMLRS